MMDSTGVYEMIGQSVAVIIMIDIYSLLPAILSVVHLQDIHRLDNAYRLFLPLSKNRCLNYKRNQGHLRMIYEDDRQTA